jgi:hypothetical protein
MNRHVIQKKVNKEARLARLRRPKIVCSPSYADFRSRENAAMWLDLDHMTIAEKMWEI